VAAPGLTRIGRRIGAPFDQVWDHFRFYGEILRPRALFGAFRYGGVIMRLITDVTVGAGALIIGGGLFFVISSLTFFTGAVVGMQGYQGLQQIGAQAYVGLVSSWANTREITPLVAGVALAAQVGAGYTAELGAMRISDEIDALEVMSVPAKIYLVCTRVWAALIPIIPLYLMALFASYTATQLIVTQYFGLSPGAYGQYFHLFLPAADVFYSITKVVIFAVVVTLIHCYYGFYASGGPAGVGVAVGRAIRTSIVAVVVLNLLLSIVMWGGGDTVRITG
jgi:phospholipid/cholesterol/gamma-HCH transport system permease protein